MGSVFRREGELGKALPSNIRGVSPVVLDRGGLRELSGVDPLARRVCLSRLRRKAGMAHESRLVALPSLSSSEFTHLRYRVRGQPKATAAMVPRHVADDGPENRFERQESL